MKVLMAALLLAVADTGSALAQTVPFDMSPERSAVESEVPASSRMPSVAVQEPTARPLQQPQLEQSTRRGLLPTGSLTLSGELATRNWSVHLTAAQAASPTRLQLAYRNAIVVAPESSTLQLFINHVPVLETPVRSSDDYTPMTVEVPAALLRAGRNEISLRARHRHRTDCTVESTYALWTEIDSARTWLSFDNPAAATFAGIADLRSLAPDAQGRTRINLVAPAIEHGDISNDVMKLVQAIALHANMPNLDFVISRTIADDEAASLRVLVGATEELAAVAGTLPPGAASGPLAAFLPDPQSGVPTLIISGRDRTEWLAAIDAVLAPVDRPVGVMREALITQQWETPDAQMIYGKRSFSFAELGIRSEQFSGRRYSSKYQFAVPGDFFADAYGQARLLVDAAYSDAILPGSLLNIYVNGNIAASVPFHAVGGAILNRLPINFTMRHFKAGLNDVQIEANLITAQDQVCLPGTTADETPRFALFDTSRFEVPQFARIAKRPDLDALVGTAFPYGRVEEPMAIVMERGDLSILSATANVLARMAISAGRAIPVTFLNAADAARQRNALFIGPINGIAPGVLTQVGVDESSRTSWSAMPDGFNRQEEGGSVDVDVWRRQLDERGIGSWTRRMGEWFSETFGITNDMLRFTPSDESGFVPSQSDVLVLAQGPNPAGTGVWTLLSAPDAVSLEQGARALARQNIWRRPSGHLATLANDYETVTSQPSANFSLVETVPPSLGNYRLIAANWLSTNILSYSLLFVLACIALGVTTSALLSRLGRGR